LDIAQLTMGTPATGNFQIMRFATIGGKESIKWQGYAPGDVAWVSKGWVYIGGSGSEVVAAFEQAIKACTQ
jgi:hypothetical protein